MSDTTYEPFNPEDNAPATKGDLKNLATKTEQELLRHDINENLGALPTKENFNGLLVSVDRIAGQIQTYNAERAAEGARIERIEKWIEKAAEKINVPIEY
jgi:hypothetical protein